MGEDFDFVKELEQMLKFGYSEDIVDDKPEEECEVDNSREESLVELQEKLEYMSQAISDAQFLVDDQLDIEGVSDRNLDLKIMMKLERIENELDVCYDLIIEENL